MINNLSFANMTPAAQLALVGVRKTRSATRRRKATKRAASPARKAKRATKRPARLVKGSAAAKRYMASIRRKRRR